MPLALRTSICSLIILLVFSFFSTSAITQDSAHETGNQSEELSQKPDVQKLLQVYDPVTAEKYNGVKELPTAIASSVAVFYAAVTISSFYDCYRNKDSASCRSYLQSLKDGMQYAGVGLFIAGSIASILATASMVKDPIAARLAAKYTGLLGGAFCSDMVLEMIRSDAWKELKAASLESDFTERTNKRWTALKKLFKETLLNTKWYNDHVPYFVSLVGAYAVTEGSLSLVTSATKNAKTILQPKKPAIPGNCNSYLAQLLTDSIPDKAPEMITKYGLNLIKTTAFLKFYELLDPQMSKAWAGMTLNSNLIDNRKNIRKGITQESLQTNAALWDAYRGRQMIEAQKILIPHLKEIASLREDLEKPNLFYRWFLDGFDIDSDYWKLIKATYKKNITPANIKDDIAVYVKSFFCGVDPKSAIIENSDLHGIPIKKKLTLLPFLALEKRDEKLCQPPRPTNDLIDMILTNRARYKAQYDETYPKFQVASSKFMGDRIRFYERRIEKELLNALQGLGNKTSEATAKLPDGVLQSFDAELDDFEKLKTTYADYIHGDELESLNEHIAKIKIKRKAAEDLLKYFSAPENPLIQPSQDYFEAIETSTSDLSATVDYFKLFMIHQ